MKNCGPQTKGDISLLGKAKLCPRDAVEIRLSQLEKSHWIPCSLAVPEGRSSLAGAKALGSAAAPQNVVPPCRVPAGSLQGITPSSYHELMATPRCSQFLPRRESARGAGRG